MKCDKVLPPLLDTVNVAIVFSFKEDDADEESSEGSDSDDSNSKSGSSKSSKADKEMDEMEDVEDDLKGTLRNSALGTDADMKGTAGSIDMKGTAGSDIAHVTWAKNDFLIFLLYIIRVYIKNYNRLGTFQI